MLDTEQKALPIKVYEYKYRYEYDQEEVVKAADGISSTSPEIYRRLFIGNKDRYEHLSMIIENLDSKGFKNYIVFSDRLDHIAEIRPSWTLISRTRLSLLLNESLMFYE